MLELCLWSELLKLIFKFLFIKRNLFSFQICDFNFLEFFCCLHSSLNLHKFSHFFPNKNYQVRKIWNQKKHVGWGGEFNQTI
jgi:hypothetical protein